MMLKEYLQTEVNALELIAIRLNGKIIHMVWIDTKDLFTVHPDLLSKSVISDSWEEILVSNKNFRLINIPCRVLTISS